MEIHDSRYGRRRLRKRRAAGALAALALAGAALAAAGRPRNAEPVASSMPVGATVAVREGDTLRVIAERIGPPGVSLATKVDRLQEANPEADLLIPGQLLRDPWH